MQKRIVDKVESQVIAAIQDPDRIEKAKVSEANVAFLLTGDLLSIKDYVQTLQQANMYVFIHLDFIEGISNDKSAITYVAKEWRPDGIITTKNHLIKTAKEQGLMTIQRIFLLDQTAFNRGIDMIRQCQPDAVEVLPGLMPRVIYELTEMTQTPVIAGGLIREEHEVKEALKAGALAVSVGNPSLWSIGL
ncbi:glycerol-3-phosphate responsive antiterminator [Caldalkalibacillus salinus]|uniref:glycerol-3-phosphate responsive antiterminator n=1 Tax=Caldalkalibacillus salinus TaxID=2803787 RepID=UPI0019236C34|nr:glycerol-3-phosphate responsive antiterminator [Caldalkalibacillus salinus]